MVRMYMPRPPPDVDELEYMVRRFRNLILNRNPISPKPEELRQHKFKKLILDPRIPQDLN